MNKYLRKSGTDIIGDLSWGAHFCQFYQTKEDLTDILIPYFKAGLEDNEFCLWITAYPLDTEEAKEALRKAIPDFNNYLENGQIKIIPYTEWYVKEGVFNSERVLNGWVEKLNQALESGYEGLRLSWNISWLEKENWGNFVDYEKIVDAVISNYYMMALCTYSHDAHDVTEAIDIVANHQFTLVKKDGKWERIENSGRKNINDRKRAEEALHQSEQPVGMKLENTLSPAWKTANLELIEIIDARAIQSLVDDFYKLAHIPIGIIDLKGNVLVGVGWQDICTEFHRAHPETCKHCVESDTKLSTGVLPGEFKLYKCKNNMWDIATPIIVGGQHVGNIFLGQFFFEGESLDYEFFRSQARQYGFNEEEYIAALEKVPRFSPTAVDKIMTFFMRFANMLSQLGYSNIKLSQSLAERDSLVDALQESEKSERAHSDELATVLDAVPVAVYISHDPQVLQITGNCLAYEWLRIPVGTNLSKSAPEGESSEMFKLFKDGVEMSPEDMPSQIAATGIEINGSELDIVSADGDIRHVLGNARPLRDEHGNIRGSISAFIDITERKEAEEALRKSFEMQKTLKTIINKSPAIAFLWKNTESWPAEFVSENVTQLGYTVENFISGDILYGDIIHKEDIEAVKENLARSIREGHNSFEMEYRIFTMDGEIRWVEEWTFIQRDSKGDVTHFQGIVVDVTGRKEAEENLKKAYDNLENLVEERTIELEKAYDLLKESEQGLAEAQRMAHIGNWEWDILADKAYWSDEMYRIFGRNPQESAPPYNEYLSYIHPDDKSYFENAARRAINGKPYSIDHRIVLANGEVRIAHIQSQVISNDENVPIRIKGIVQDITERKNAENALVNLEIARKKEIHHRIKNNLQVISSLLDLQAENLSNRKCVKDSDVLNAFRESQNRIMSIALIHEELHEGGGDDTLNFSLYLERLVKNLFQTYRLGNIRICLNIDLEKNIFFDMDTAVPLGIIVNELVSNSLEHAFSCSNKGEIRIKLFKEEKAENNPSNDKKELTGKGTGYTLIVSDDGVGIPEKIDLEKSDTLGLQLVSILIDQLDGEVELKRDRGTEFDIRIKV